MSKITNQEVKDRIIDKLKNKGLSVNQVSTEFGISRNTIYGWLGKKTVGDPSILEISRLRKEDNELKQIIGGLSLSTWSVGKKITRARSMIHMKKSVLAKKLGLARSTLYYKSKKKENDERDRTLIEEVMIGNQSYGHIHDHSD